MLDPATVHILLALASGVLIGLSLGLIGGGGRFSPCRFFFTWWVWHLLTSLSELGRSPSRPMLR